MKQQYLLNDYLDHEKHKTVKDRFLYLSLAFRPASVLLICIILTIIISVPCVIILSNTPTGSLLNNIALALFTGVIVSGAVSISLELVNNYRHNYQRLLILHEYLLTVAHYEEHVQWNYHGRKDENCPGKFTVRNMAVSELILEIGSVIEEAYKNGKEYMSLEEMKHVITIIEAASKIGDLAEGFVYENMVDTTGANLYKGLKKPIRSEVSSFAKDVGIVIVDDELTKVVADYILTKPDELSYLDQSYLKEFLEQFDMGMCDLQGFIKSEPGYHIELIPWERRFEKNERKLHKKTEKVEKDTLKKLEDGLVAGRITQSEYDEFMELDAEISNHKGLDLKPLYDKYGYDSDDDAFFDEMEEMAYKQSDERYKKLMREMYILFKADGRNLESS